MSDRPGERPFWHDVPANDVGDDRGELTSASDVETPTDDDAGDADVITIGDHKFVWGELPHVEVTLQDEAGNELQTAYFPYDPDNQPTEEAVTAQAAQLYADLDHLRSILIQEVVLDLAQTIEESGTATTIIKAVADAARDELVFTARATDGEPPEEVEATRQSVERLFRDNLEMIIGEVAAGGETPGMFWQDFARDVLAHALLWARDETTEELGESAARMSDAEFEEATLAAYRNGPYITQAMLTLAQGRIQTLGELFVMFLKHTNETPDGGKLLDAFIQKARRSRAAHPLAGNATGSSSASAAGMTTAETAPAPLSTPAFTPDGYGRVHNDPVSAGARLMLVSPWSGLRSTYPVFSFGNGAGQAIYAPSEKTYPTAADAWKAVERYDDAHVDLFDYILAKMLASKTNNQRDVYGDFRLTPEEVLDGRGIAKHVKGGHKPENVREIIRQINDLAGIEVRAQISGHTQGGKGKRGKRETITLEHAVELIAIHETLYEVTLTGERVPIAWQLRPGNWARELERFTPQYAVMMQGILKLHARRDANAKRIGRYLVYQYRIRAHERSWAQPYRVCDLLTGAGIEIDRSNPGRFRKRIEAALDILANPEEMRGPICIKVWHYPHAVAASGRGWLDDWLESGVVILPPDELARERYQSIGARKRRPQQPRKLANGDTK